MYGILGLVTCYRDAFFCNSKTYFIVRTPSNLGKEIHLLPLLSPKGGQHHHSPLCNKALRTSFSPQLMNHQADNTISLSVLHH